MTAARITVSATFTGEPLRCPLERWLAALGLAYSVEFAPYGQVFQQLLDPASHLGANADGPNVLLIRSQDLVSESGQIRSRFQELTEAILSYLSRSSAYSIVCFGPPSSETGQPLDPSWHEELVAAENELVRALPKSTALQTVISSDLARAYPVENPFDAIANRTAHIPYTSQYFTALATLIARRLYGRKRGPTKVVALDCDNTLWSGVVAEDGIAGLRIGEEHRLLQQRMLELRDSGVLLCLCSKNNEQDVWEVFDNHPDMCLRREHITAAEINWQAKSTSLQTLSRNLKLGLESFVFLDDSPLECAEVRSGCPQVLSLGVPQSKIDSFIRNVWAFDLSQTTETDRERAKLYREEMVRNASRQAAPTLEGFLRSLDLQVFFQAIDSQNIDRVAQLSQRTNQFNCTLKRYSSRDLTQELSETGEKFGFAMEVRDRFGNYGIVGAVIYKFERSILVVEALFISCRALGRGVERHVMRHMGEVAFQAGVGQVLVDFVSGPRNQPAETFLSTLGSLDAQGRRYQYDASSLRMLDLFAVEESHATEARSTDVSETLVAPSELMTRVATELQSVEQIEDYFRATAADRPQLPEPFVPAKTEAERQVVNICQDVLAVKQVGLNDSLSALGASSVQLVMIYSQLCSKLKARFSITDLYSLPTVKAIVEKLADEPVASVREERRNESNNGIAIIGMAGRFPGASNVREFWKNLKDGVCSIIDLPEESLNLPLDSPLRSNPNLVRRAASIAAADKFDAKFFGIFPREATVMDPQHRILLECCWHAFEDAGINVDSLDVPVGVYAGCYMDTYILSSLASNPQMLESLANSFHGGDLLTELGNDKDYLATRISYLLDLRGPSITVQTACSTSLVAIAEACQSLTSRQCDMALAGGVTLKLPQNRGYLYTDGGMVSPDGVCRTFDANARGTVFGEGCGVVLLKRVDDAIADGDDIYAVIKGCGLNNDGHAKVGYTAPSVEGQSGAIERAHRQANISAETISYVEAHGTGTSLGDPIEIDSLTRAFRKTTDRRQYCAIGSLKTNIGHLDVAAGVTGLIKTSLALRHGLIPPSLHFEKPNPNIDFAASPFYVNTALAEWTAPSPRRAGLSSFGVGGTNAHVVVEEAPPIAVSEESEGPQLIVLSAKSQPALDQMTEQLAEHLRNNLGLSLSDIAYTLQVGRKTFNYTRALVASSVGEMVETLTGGDSKRIASRHQVRRGKDIVFLFPGQGSQHVNMARELVSQEAAFRNHFDHCVELLIPILGFDLRSKIFHEGDDRVVEEINETLVAQTSIFAVSYAIAKALEEYGVNPSRMIGHSVGEFVAACIAGVFTLEDALRLIAFRASRMQAMPPGSMLAVRMAEAELVGRLSPELAIAAINSPVMCVVSGPTQSVEALQKGLESQGVGCRMLRTSHAFHSCMMDQVVEPFEEMLQSVALNAPNIPIISSVTGVELSERVACDPRYWATHLRETVRFTDALETLCQDSEEVLLEVGPGQTLSTLARQHPALKSEQAVLSMLPHAKQAESSRVHAMRTIGRLWQHGVEIDWKHYYARHNRRKVHLPGYPFERQRYWFEENCQSQEVSRDVEKAAMSASEPPVDLGIASEKVEPIESPEPKRPDESGASVENAISGSSLQAIRQRVVQQQLELMKLQLEVWKKR